MHIQVFLAWRRSGPGAGNILTACLLTALFMAPAMARTAAEEPWLLQLDARMTKALRKERVTGAAIVVVDQSGTLFSAGYGYADRKQRLAVTPQTRFPFANVTKVVTAMAALQLVDQGLVGLDQPITEVLPKLAIESRFPATPSPTLRQLLSHHSGLPSNVLAGNYVAQPPTQLMRQVGLYQAQPPGIIYGYSNQAYLLVGHLIESLTGRPYPQVIKSQILDPLHMDHAGFAPHPQDARGHSKGGRVQPDIYARDLPAMGLRGSIQDLGRLLHWTLRKDSQPLLNRALRAQMSAVQNADVALDLDNRTGLAWQLTNTDGFQVQSALRVTAATLEFRGTVIIIPEHGVAVALFANSPDSMDFVLEQARLTIDELLHDRAQLPLPDRDKQSFPATVAMPATARPTAMSARYVTPLGLMQFAGDEQRYDVKYLGKSFRARRRDDGWYELSYRLLGLIDIQFDMIRELLLRPALIENQPVLLVYYQDRRFLFGSALRGHNADAPLALLAGTYKLQNPDFFSQRLKLNKVELKFEDGLLFGVYRLPLFISLKPQIPLVQHVTNEFYVPGLGTAQGERLRYDQPSQSFEFAGYRFSRSN